MAFVRVLLLVLIAATVSACGGQSIWATDEEVASRRYVSPDAPYLELKTMIHNKTGAGGHAALVINSGQLVMYDPAGRWHHTWVPERNDVLFGLSPDLMQQYDSFHARDTHHVVTQRIYVSAEVAAMAKQLAYNKGPSMDAQCTLNTSEMLTQLPGFQSLKRTWFPRKLMEQFAELPGVKESKYYESDVGKNW